MARRPAKIVLDSSVIVKWFTNEDGSSSALKLLDSFTEGSLEITISELAFYEAANALRYKPDLSREGVRRCIPNLLELELDVKKLDTPLLEESVNVAFDGKVTFYNAIPVAIAKLEGIQCITADLKSQYMPLSLKHYPVRLL